jgi:hypothetical protein
LLRLAVAHAVIFAERNASLFVPVLRRVLESD